MITKAIIATMIGVLLSPASGFAGGTIPFETKVQAQLMTVNVECTGGPWFKGVLMASDQPQNGVYMIRIDGAKDRDNDPLLDGQKYALLPVNECVITLAL